MTRIQPDQLHHDRIETPHIDKAPGVFHGRARKPDAEQALWTPAILSPFSLLIFLACFVAIAIALPVLYVVSERNHGLSNADSKLFYLWTYGPTAVFTLVAAFWSRLEYRYKQLMPWKSLRTGKLRASQTVLLDYVSPWSLKVLFTSAKEKHFMVTLPVLGNLLLTLILVFSTGLFSLQETAIRVPVSIAVSQLFNSTGVDLNTTRESPWEIAYGIRYLDLTRPYGTTAHHLFPHFNISDELGLSYSKDDVLEAELDIFTFDMPCETAEVTLAQEHLQGNFTLTTPTCSMTREYDSFDGRAFDGYTVEDLSMFVGGCNNNGAELRVNAIARTNGTIGVPVVHFGAQNSTWYQQFVAVTCIPTYNVRRGLVSFSGSPGSAVSRTNVSFNLADPASKLPGLEDSEFVKTIWKLGTYVMGQTMFKFVAYGRPADVNNTAYLADLLREVHSDIAVQMAQQLFMSNSASTSNGFVERTQPRLYVRLLSLALIEASVVILIVILLLMLFGTSPRVCSRNPGLLGGIAAIISSGEDFKRLLLETGGTGGVFEKRTRNLRFSTVSGTADINKDTFRIRCSNDSAPLIAPGSDLDRPQSSSKWWRPFFASVSTRCLVVLMPTVIIVALEILHRRSSSSSGIAILSDTDSPYLRYTWAYIPALVMVAVRTAIEASAFTIRLFLPYSTLRVGGQLARDTLLQDRLGKTSVENLFAAVRLRRLALAAITVAALLAPFLTIVVSGLYTIEAFGIVKAITVDQTSVWSSRYISDKAAGLLKEGANDYQSPYASLGPSMMLSANLSDPKWTHGQLIFPSIRLTSSQDAQDFESLDVVAAAKISVVLPALRSSLNCTTLPDRDVSYIFVPFSSRYGDGLNYTQLNFDTTRATSPGCPDLQWWCSDGVAIDKPTTQLKTGDFFDCYADSWEGKLATGSLQDFPECPTTGYSFGRLNATDQISRTNAFHCRPFIEQIQVETNFLLPNFDIDTARPPRPIASSASLRFDARIEHGYKLGFTNMSTEPTTENLHPWFKAMIFGAGGVPAVELLGSENSDTLDRRLEDVLGLWTAHFAHVYMRNPTPGNITGNENSTSPGYFPTYNTTLSTSQGMRLVQDTISTRILQALLGTIVLCAIVAFLSQDTRHVLHDNPCSIAAVASLLAGAEFLNLFPPGSEFCSDTELAELLDGMLFSMGWWKRGGGLWFGIDVGQCDAKNLEDFEGSGGSNERREGGMDPKITDVRVTSH